MLLAPAASFPSVANAQQQDQTLNDAARLRFQEGVDLFDKGMYEEARAAFLQAYALKKHPAVLLNLAFSELRSQRPADAARHFSEFLRDTPDISPDQRESATTGLALARSRTSRVEVNTDVRGAEVFVDGVLVGQTPLPEPVDVTPGVRSIEVRASNNRTKTEQVEAVLFQVATVDLAFGIPETQSMLSQRAIDIQASTGGRTPFFTWLVTDKVAWAPAAVTVVGVFLGPISAAVWQNSATNANHTRDMIRMKADDNADDIIKKYLSEGHSPKDAQDFVDRPCGTPVVVIDKADFNASCNQLRRYIDRTNASGTAAIVGFTMLGVGAVSTGVLYFVRTSPNASAPSTTASTVLGTTQVVPVIAPTFQGLSFTGSF